MEWRFPRARRSLFIHSGESVVDHRLNDLGHWHRREQAARDVFVRKPKQRERDDRGSRCLASRLSDELSSEPGGRYCDRICDCNAHDRRSVRQRRRRRDDVPGVLDRHRRGVDGERGGQFPRDWQRNLLARRDIVQLSSAVERRKFHPIDHVVHTLASRLPPSHMMWLTISSSSRSQYLHTTRSGLFDRTMNSDSIGSGTFEMQFGLAHRRIPTARSGRVTRRFSATL